MSMGDTKRQMQPNVGGGVDRDKLTDSDFVFSDSRTFPVVKPGDVSDAVSSWGRYKGPHTFEDFKRRLIALCRRKGPAFVAALPKDWDVKAVIAVKGAFELDVLGLPFGSADDKDAQGEWFDGGTQFHSDKWPLPPVVYYHSFNPDGTPAGAPAYIGRTVKRWVDAAGVWFRAVLDDTSDLAQRVIAAARQGAARASSGGIAHLCRVDSDGHIREWPVGELSLFDMGEGRTPANRHAVALPAMKAVYEQAGIALPDEVDEPDHEGTPTGADSAGVPGEGRSAMKHDDTRSNEMDEQTIQAAIAQGIEAALKAKQDAADAEAKRRADFDVAVKAEVEKRQAEGRRLPGGGAPYVAKYAGMRKFDNLDPGEHALLVAILEAAAGRGLATAQRASDDCLRGLALKAESAAAKGHTGAAMADMALKSFGLKADEIERTTLTAYGLQWVGTLYSQQLWEAIRQNCWVLAQLAPQADEIPDGYASETIPLEGADPTWYAVAQAADTTSGRPAATVTSSRVGTPTSKNIAIAKMGCRVLYTGEMNEDSLVRFAPQAMRQIQLSGQEQFEHAIIDGDTDLTINTNINRIAGTPAGTEVYTLVNGFRKLPIITETTNKRSGGVLDEDDYLETVKLLGVAGINADVTKVGFLVDMPTYWKSLALAALKTKDVWERATMQSGQLTNIWGYPLKASAFMHYISTSRCANTAGKVDYDVQGNNVTGSILAVRWDQWKLKWKRRMTVETDRWIESDTNQIVAMVRWGLGYRDVEASAVTYNLTV